MLDQGLIVPGTTGLLYDKATRKNLPPHSHWLNLVKLCSNFRLCHVKSGIHVITTGLINSSINRSDEMGPQQNALAMHSWMLSPNQTRPPVSVINLLITRQLFYE